MRTVERQHLYPWQRHLLAAAEEAAASAQCPYSGFPVGAAVRIRGRGGETLTVTGNNFETANYRSVCAEKHAVHRALAEHSWVRDGELARPEVLAVAVYCAVAGTPQQPCGDCRQTLYEIDPAIEVLAAAGPGRGDGTHDPRVTLTTVRALLPHGFAASSLGGTMGTAPAPVVHEPEGIADFVVHLPKPADLEADREARSELLCDVSYLLLVGSPRRARRVAELAHRRFGARRDAAGSCYCDLTVAGRDESGREYALYVSELAASGRRIAIVSHGLGEAGVEIALSEVPALLALAAGRAADLRAVIRCGTRATLSRVPLGAVALSTSSCGEDLSPLAPSAAWVRKLRQAALSRGMTVVADGEIDARGDDGWPEATRVLAEGAGISTSFFWRGQGRPLYRGAAALPAAEIGALERRQRGALLAAWVAAGLRWIEMEDATVLRHAALCGLPAATLGAIVAHRRRRDGSFQLDYSPRALAASELLPAEIALTAIAADAGAGE